MNVDIIKLKYLKMIYFSTISPWNTYILSKHCESKLIVLLQAQILKNLF